MVSIDNTWDYNFLVIVTGNKESPWSCIITFPDPCLGEQDNKTHSTKWKDKRIDFFYHHYDGVSSVLPSTGKIRLAKFN